MRLRTLVGEAERVISDPKYEQLKRLWNDFYALRVADRIPIKITLNMSFFAKVLNINLIDHYEKPEKYVENSLKMLIFQHRAIPDDRVIEGIVLTYGEAFESSLFGSKPIFKHDTDSWVGKPIITKHEDLENLTYPDFYESGLMPKAIKLYETAQNMLKGKIPVFFERWDRSPWGIAVHLRGFTELLLDTLQNPDFVHKLLSFITESRMKWEREREKFLGTKIEKAFLYNDEVNAQVISPEMYEVFAHPYEKKLADFYPRGIFYFHSCGDITPFLDTIATIRGLRKLHISPATNFQTVTCKLGRKFTFQKRMHPLKDLGSGDAATMELRIKEALRIGRNTFMELDPGPIQDESPEKIRTWISVARRATKSKPG